MRIALTRSGPNSIIVGCGDAVSAIGRTCVVDDARFAEDGAWVMGGAGHKFQSAEDKALRLVTNGSLAADTGAPSSEYGRKHPQTSASFTAGQAVFRL